MEREERETNRLEGLLSGNSELLSSLNEGVDVLHASEVRDGLLDLLHRVRLDSIGESEEKNS